MLIGEMNSKIVIKDSNGLRKAYVVLHRLRHLPHHNQIKSRVKAWMKVQQAIDNYNEVLINNQDYNPFCYISKEEIRSYHQRLQDGFYCDQTD